ncbi:MAG: hypothetical protein QF815_00680 [Candidatus Peribacteraceae bacterium]|jgi:hypothetical protein|nr:hypothetical protein [Candidatus Peribacteraceae bacterium]
MDDFVTQVAGAKDLTIDEQKKAGVPVKGKMDGGHNDFLKNLKALLDSGEIDPYVPKSIINQDVYDSLDETWQDKADLTIVNVANQIRLIQEFMESNETPDESPQLQTMVEHLWQMKQTIEREHDVFKI